jgi:hypothetical protein
VNAGLFEDQPYVHEFPQKGTNGHEWRSFAVTQRSRIPMNIGLPDAFAVTARSRPLSELVLNRFRDASRHPNADVRARTKPLGASFKSPTTNHG